MAPPKFFWYYLLICYFDYLCSNLPRRDEVTGDWRRLHNEELNDLYSLPNIVQVIKSRRMRWAGHVASMGEERGVYKREEDHWGDLGVEGE